MSDSSQDAPLTRNEAIAMLKAGKVEKWNAIRHQYPDWKPCLSDADLSSSNLPGIRFNGTFLDGAALNSANLNGATFTRAICNGANFSRAYLQGASFLLSHLELTICIGADFNGALFRNANLRMAKLRWSDLRWTDFDNAYLINADLTGANLGRTSLANTDFSNACFANTIFSDVNLSTACGLDTARHLGPSTLGVDTIIKSKSMIPESFLRGCGVPDEWITHIPSLIGAMEPIQFYSCFISYAIEDEEFATRLYNDFQAAGIRCWKWNEDAKTGKSLWGEIDHAIQHYDKLVLIASKHSLTSTAVNREIERAIRQEDVRTQQKAKGKYSGDADVLFPVTVDNYIFSKWEHERKVDVTKKMIADATGWKKDHNKCQRVIDRLIKDLKAEINSGI
jgi:hypothetical protein